MIYVLMFARTPAGRSLLGLLFGAMAVISVYYGLKRKITVDLQKDAIVEERSRVDEAVRRRDAVPDNVDRMRESSDSRWCRDC